MASSFFALFDDIATLMDDVAVMSKTAMKKTSGIIGDDLALNANQMVGFSASRELPIVWAVSKGSLLNKAILIPLALLLTYFLPFLISILLMLGGLYLCYEGIEKTLHTLFPTPEDEASKKDHIQNLQLSEEEILAFEKTKIKAAIRTDFILSGEIIVITLGLVVAKPLFVQAGVLAGIALAMTVGVYGVVGLLIKLDDIGLYLQQKGKLLWLSKALLIGTPKLLKFLSFAGTVAMFLVGGGIFVHQIAFLHHFQTTMIPSNGFSSIVLNMLFELIVGVVFGLMVYGLIQLFKKFKRPQS
ncbi:MAG: DUF808 domain-containing protein [Proteobacteria bacterium]|jgi:predicted DNA repair protein MutK|nr:DUF808 domain-containing protein [Pseudomonadota bacterium]